MNSDFRHLVTTVISASSKSNFDKELRNYQARIQVLNPNCEVKLDIKPNPETVDFSGSTDGIGFNVSVFLRDE